MRLSLSIELLSKHNQNNFCAQPLECKKGLITLLNEICVEYTLKSTQCHKQSNLYIFWVFNKNKNNLPLHCVSWINSDLQII